MIKVSKNKLNCDSCRRCLLIVNIRVPRLLAFFLSSLWKLFRFFLLKLFAYCFYDNVKKPGKLTHISSPLIISSPVISIGLMIQFEPANHARCYSVWPIGSWIHFIHQSTEHSIWTSQSWLSLFKLTYRLVDPFYPPIDRAFNFSRPINCWNSYSMLTFSCKLGFSSFVLWNHSILWHAKCSDCVPDVLNIVPEITAKHSLFSLKQMVNSIWCNNINLISSLWRPCPSPGWYAICFPTKYPGLTMGYRFDWSGTADQYSANSNLGFSFVIIHSKQSAFIFMIFHMRRFFSFHKPRVLLHRRSTLVFVRLLYIVVVLHRWYLWLFYSYSLQHTCIVKNSMA